MRADKYFATRFGSRTKAKEVLGKGLIQKNGKPLSPKDEIDSDEGLLILECESFASNGGYKLDRGLDVFEQSVSGMTVADLGASTGGFTDCLLRRGARRVYCVDVGECQLHPSLAEDSRVVVMDGTNARYLKRTDFPEPIDVVVGDLSFISLKLVVPAVCDILEEGGKAFLLFKPQFECGGVGLGKSGIVPTRYHLNLLKNFYAFCIESGMSPLGVVNAPIREKKNIEYVVFLQKSGIPVTEWEFLRESSRFFEQK